MEIYPIDAKPGRIGMSPLPGRGGALDDDMADIAVWGAGLVLTMTSAMELERAGASDLGHRLARHGIGWWHLPIEDFGAPSTAVQQAWSGAAIEAHGILDRGGHVLAHCYGGCGRSGMAVLRLLVERGEAAEPALARMRAARGCAVETEAQFRWAASAPVRAV